MTGMAPALALRPLAELVAGLAAGAPALVVSDLALDSRQVRAGALFLACQGTKQHGLAFLPEALARGAGAVLWEPAPGVAPPQCPVPAIAVENLSRHVSRIAARFFGDPSHRLHCVGITGTDGKTSTACLVAQALDRLEAPCVYLGTLGAGRIGALRVGDQTTPDPVSLQRELRAALDAGAVAAAMEVSSHALDQSRVAAVRFDTAVLTNVGRDHLDYHGTVERYAAAKQRLFFELEPRAAVLNRDDPAGAAWAAALPPGGPRVTRYGIGEEAGQGRWLSACDVQLGAHGLRFEIRSHAGRARIESRLLGRFNVYNLLAALGVLLEREVPLERACAALSQAPTVPGRMEGFRGARAAPLVVVDYAHTPQALRQVLEAARAHCAGQLWCVFGCGGDRDRGKRPLMGAAAAQLADRVILTDDNPRSEDPALIVQEIRAGFPAGCSAPVVHDRAEAIARAVREAAADDVVVVAGKGHEEYQQYGKERRTFSDRAFVAALVGDERPEVRGQGPGKP